MSLSRDKIISECPKTFSELNAEYGSSLPKYEFEEVDELPTAPANAEAQTFGLEKTIRIKIWKLPGDEGGVPRDYIKGVLAHESIHAKIFQDWKDCGSETFKLWRAKVPIAR